MDRLNEAPRQPAMVENHVSKVEKLNRERVCKKRLAIRMKIERKKEVKALADSLKETCEA